MFFTLLCDARQDEQAEHVQIRLQGAAIDLHAADKRYLDSCRKFFMNPKNVRAAQNPREKIPNEYAAVAFLVQ